MDTVNMKNTFKWSDFDPVDIVLDTDVRFDTFLNDLQAGGEDRSAKDILKEMCERTDTYFDEEAYADADTIWEGCGKCESCGKKNCSVKEDDLMQYNPEDPDAITDLDQFAEDYLNYMYEGTYEEDDENGEIIDCIMGDCEDFMETDCEW